MCQEQNCGEALNLPTCSAQQTGVVLLAPYILCYTYMSSILIFFTPACLLCYAHISLLFGNTVTPSLARDSRAYFWLVASINSICVQLLIIELVDVVASWLERLRI